MSAYIEFYLKVEDKFVPIASYSRSNILYEVGHDSGVPWEKIRKLDKELFSEMVNKLNTRIDAYEMYIDENESRKSIIASMLNSIEDKIKALDELQHVIDEMKNSLSEYETAQTEFRFMSELESESGYPVYIGIEVGEPTVEENED